jgi:hypothetical protein
MTKTENERLARMEGKLDMMIDEFREVVKNNREDHKDLYGKMDSHNVFRGRVKAGLTVLAFLITTLIAWIGVM